MEKINPPLVSQICTSVRDHINLYSCSIYWHKMLNIYYMVIDFENQLSKRFHMITDQDSIPSTIEYTKVYEIIVSTAISAIRSKNPGSTPMNKIPKVVIPRASFEAHEAVTFSSDGDFTKYITLTTRR